MSLFVPGSELVAAGTDVTLAISIENTALRFELQGRVRLQLAGKVEPHGDHAVDQQRLLG